MASTEPEVDVGGCNVGEVLATLHGDEASLRADCVKESHRQGSRARTGFDDCRTREDVAHVGDHAGILRIDDGSTTGH